MIFLLYQLHFFRLRIFKMEGKSKYDDQQRLVNYALNIHFDEDEGKIIVEEDYLRLTMYRILNEPLNALF